MKPNIQGFAGGWLGFGIDAHWSDGYFDINAQGELIAYPDGDQTKPAISLSQLTEQFKQQGLTLPVLVRFTDILKNRVDTLTNAFTQARTNREYNGKYTCVYPIKVNQQRSVVSKLLASDTFGASA